MYTISEETLCDKWAELLPLLKAHRNELATHPHLMRVLPGFGKYEALENAGMLLVLVARDKLGKIVGYSGNMVYPNMHYSELVMGHNDVLYVPPEHRGGTLGLRLIKQTEGAMRLRGVKLLLWHAKQHTKLDHMMPKLGYAVQDIMYSKEL
jgi:GNAT superfamily N-acetyltransferase